MTEANEGEPTDWDAIFSDAPVSDGGTEEAGCRMFKSHDGETCIECGLPRDIHL